MSPATGRPSGARRWRRRLAVLAAVATVASGMGIISAAPAVADTAVPVHEISCPDWVPRWQPGSYGQILGNVEVTPVFLVADSRIVRNDTDNTITGTFTSQVSATWQVTVGVGLTMQNVVQHLNVTINTSIVSGITTQLGVSTQTPVPPHSAVVGDYGVESYHVVYDAYVVFVRDRMPGRCWIRSDTNGVYRTASWAPTHIQGWRVRPA
jgi:hypothetical protein